MVLVLSVFFNCCLNNELMLLELLIFSFIFELDSVMLFDKNIFD